MKIYENVCGVWIYILQGARKTRPGGGAGVKVWGWKVYTVHLSCWNKLNLFLQVVIIRKLYARRPYANIAVLIICTERGGESVQPKYKSCLHIWREGKKARKMSTQEIVLKNICVTNKSKVCVHATSDYILIE